MLSVVSTPIGNLADATQRAKDTLSQCAAIVCEDTRVTGKLLQLLGIEKRPLISLHSHSAPHVVEGILQRLRDGDHLALVSDAGTPGISDPGYQLVHRCRLEGIRIEPIPGASAFLAALSASGLPVNTFTYLGFLPLKKGRRTLLASLQHIPHTVVFYESVHRIAKTLHELAEALAMQPERTVVIARELTKAHEEIITLTVQELADAAATVKQKGEFTVVIGPAHLRAD